MTPVPDDFGDWLDAARAGSRDALGNSLEACRRYLLSIAQHELDVWLRAKGGASDMVQETFLEAQRAFGRFQGHSEAELRAWLRCLLHDRLAKLGRRYRTTQKRKLARETVLCSAETSAGDRFAEPARSLTPSTQLMAEEQRQQLHTSLERLPEDYRRVIQLRFEEKCSFEEIGRRLQRTPNAARLLWLRAIERVKRELRDADEW
jgi:RNA polymerase sigma-70 factor (ECF subfamily)